MSTKKQPINFLNYPWLNVFSKALYSSNIPMDYRLDQIEKRLILEIKLEKLRV